MHGHWHFSSSAAFTRRSSVGLTIQCPGNRAPRRLQPPLSAEPGVFSSGQRDVKSQFARSALIGRVKTFSLLLYCYCPVFLFLACTSSPQETSKALVKISNVTLSRLDKRTLRVTLNYDLEAGVKLPLPYKSVLVFPLEPRGKLLAGQVPEMEFSTGLIALDLEIPADAGFDWKDLEAKGACCVVSLKGTKDVLGSNVPAYERISNSVTTAVPQLAG